MKNNILYVGQFKLPDRDAAAVRVSAMADALRAAGYLITFIADNSVGPSGTDRSVPLFRRFPIVVSRGIDLLVTSSSFSSRVNEVDWTNLAAVICYPGSTALISRLISSCRKYRVPLIIDSTEWYAPSHTAGGRFGPFALDSELRMRWLYPRAGNVICISSFLARHYGHKGCNVVRVPPLVGLEKDSELAVSTVEREHPEGHLTLVYAGFPGRKELFAEILTGLQAARNRGIEVSLKLVGIAEDELISLLKRNGSPVVGLDGVSCYGRVPRAQALEIVAGADFTVILRPNERYANAGFPSKLVESLSLGVPVMSNATSDIAEFLRDGIDGYLLSESSSNAIEDAIVRASKLTSEQKHGMRTQSRLRAHECFGYQNYTEILTRFVSSARLCN